MRPTRSAHQPSRVASRNRRVLVLFFFSSRRRHTRSLCDWSSDVCSSDLETAGITNFLVRAVVCGGARGSGTQVAETAEDIGGALDASGEVESAEIRGEALARHWEELLGLIAEVALEPSLRGEEIERERRLVLSQIKTRAETPFSLSLDTLLRELYGSHPYAWHSLGLKSAVERLGRAQLAAHYRAVFRADRAVLAVSGQVSRERVVRAAERIFTKLPRSGAHEVGAAPPAAPSGERRVLERPAQQAQILAGYLGPGLNRSEEHTSELQSHSDLVCRPLLEKKKPRASRPERSAR